jgi:hypothetical protein
VELVWEHHDDALHEVLLRDVVAARHHLLQHARQHHVAVQLECEAIQLGQVRQVLPH